MIAGRPDVRVVAVSRLANYVNKLLSGNRHLVLIGVSGEISNYRPNSNGNVYFDLKDRDALLNCVAFSEAAAAFPAMANGDQIVAYGSVTTFPRKSTYQLRVLEVRTEGETGALHQRYETLRARLAAEGLFADERKRALPRFPFRVALVTSRSAEGARDFETQARERAPHVEIVVVPTTVQGEKAAPEIAAAIARAERLDVDVIVLARGGGSFEDLFAFSDERVVRALAASPIPTVSAIGHEGDAPLTDFVADRRAATPSAAAQTLLPRRDDLLRMVDERRRTLARDLDRLVSSRRQLVDARARRLFSAARERVSAERESLHRYERRLNAAGPAARLAQRRGRFDAVRAGLAREIVTLLRRRRERLAAAAQRLGRVDPALRIARAAGRSEATAAGLDAALRRLLERRAATLRTLAVSLDGNNPETILQRGYAIVRGMDGRPLRDAADAPPGTTITAELARGHLHARVEREGTDGGRQIGLF